jgi:hypothetical protein
MSTSYNRWTETDAGKLGCAFSRFSYTESSLFDIRVSMETARKATQMPEFGNWVNFERYSMCTTERTLCPSIIVDTPLTGSSFGPAIY